MYCPTCTKDELMKYVMDNDKHSLDEETGLSKLVYRCPFCKRTTITIIGTRCIGCGGRGRENTGFILEDLCKECSGFGIVPKEIVIDDST